MNLPVGVSNPPPSDDHQIEALERRAKFLNIQYGVLFVGSMLVLVYNWTGGRTNLTTILWAALLGGAVVTRVYRTSVVNKMNRLIGGGSI